MTSPTRSHSQHPIARRPPLQDYAGFWRRVGAAMVDGVVTELACGMLLLALSAAGLQHPHRQAEWFALLIFWLYYASMESSAQRATLGKQVVGVKVSGLDGHRLSFVRATGRTFAKFLSAIPLGLGFLLAAWTPRKRGLHDMLAGSLVVRTGPSHFWRGMLTASLATVLWVAGLGAYVYYVRWPEWKRSFSGGLTMAITPGITGKSPLTESLAEHVDGPVNLDARSYEAHLSSGTFAFVKGTTAKAGPAVLELSNFWNHQNSAPTVWVEVYLPHMPNLGLPSKRALILIDHVADDEGADVYDHDSSLETAAFQRLSFSSRNQPRPHLHAIRSVHLKRGTTKKSLRSIEGRLILLLPIGVQTLELGASDVGEPQTVGDAQVRLTGLGGSEVTLEYTGPARRYVATLGYNAAGQPLNTLSSGHPASETAPVHHLKNVFKGEVAAVHVTVADEIIEREFPFVLSR